VLARSDGRLGPDLTPTSAECQAAIAVDRTGLTGVHDFALTFAYEGRVAGSMADRKVSRLGRADLEGPPCVFSIAEAHGRQHVDGV
jgi:hypothetical protein